MAVVFKTMDSYAMEISSRFLESSNDTNIARVSS